MFKVLQSLKIVQNDPADLLTAAATWAEATDLGDIKGKPFLKVTCDPDLNVETQAGTKQFSSKGHFETSTLALDSATDTAIKAMIGLNVSLMATPAGTVSASNPILIVKNFMLQSSVDREIGDVSFRKLSGDKPVFDESEVSEELAVAPA
jgi:hypothetical protein